jgi:nitrogen regulatory protein P-II 1
MMRSFDLLEESYGVLSIKDVTTAYELGTKLKGDEVLVSK